MPRQSYNIKHENQQQPDAQQYGAEDDNEGVDDDEDLDEADEQPGLVQSHSAEAPDEGVKYQ